MPDSFATTEDVAARWRPLTPTEKPVASTLLDDASDIIRSRFPGIDANAAVSSQTLKRIVCGMVKRAMLNGAVEGVTQQSQAAGPFNLSQTFANPNGNLYLSSDDLAALEGRPVTKGRAVTRWLA